VACGRFGENRKNLAKPEQRQPPAVLASEAVNNDAKHGRPVSNQQPSISKSHGSTIMISKLRNLSRGFQDLHEDEDGMEAIQVVAIVAIAAIVLIFVKGTLWPRVQNWVNQQVGDLTGN
jgi:hypothetical protein